MLTYVSSAQDSGLTLREVIANIPHDAPAVFIYVLMALFVGLPLWLSRHRDGSSTDGKKRPE